LTEKESTNADTEMTEEDDLFGLKDRDFLYNRDKIIENQKKEEQERLKKEEANNIQLKIDEMTKLKEELKKNQEKEKENKNIVKKFS